MSNAKAFHQFGKRIAIEPDEAAVARLVAARIVEHLRDEPHPVVVVPTGRTFESVYAALRAIHASTPMDVRNTTFVQLDELVTQSHGATFLELLNTLLLQPLGVPRVNVVGFDSATAHPDAESVRVGRALDAAGGATLALVGVGVNGHVGFNEPPSDSTSTSRRVQLASTTRSAAAAYFDMESDDVATHGMTLGVRDILAARTRILVATGAHKADIVRAALRDELRSDIPASIVAHAEGTSIFLDAAAGVGLRSGSALDGTVLSVLNSNDALAFGSTLRQDGLPADPGIARVAARNGSQVGEGNGKCVT